MGESANQGMQLPKVLWMLCALVGVRDLLDCKT